MKNFKFFFENGAIISCSITNVQIPGDGSESVFIQRDEENKTIIYAIVRAETEAQAYRQLKAML